MNKINESKIEIGETSSGSKKYITVYEIHSKKNGKNVYIQANMHGPEIAGTPVVLKLKDFLKKNLLYGSVTLVPCANPWGVDTKFEGMQGGYINHSGDKYGNWNRIFPDLTKLYKSEIDTFIKENKSLTENGKKTEYKKLLIKLIKNEYLKKKATYQLTKEQILSYYLLEFSINSDIVIDLHTSGNCVKHVYYFSHQFNSVKNFGIKNLVELPYGHIGVFDESNIKPWHYLYEKKFLKAIPSETYTVELFGDGYSSASEVEIDCSYILSFLSSKGLVNDSELTCKEYVKASENNHFHIYSPIGGIFQASVKVGETVKKGDLLGTVKNQSRVYIVKSPFKGIIYQECNNHATETGQSLMGIFTDPEIVDRLR